MPTLDRVRAGWTGFAGAPGVSTFYVQAAAPMVTALRAFFFNISGHIPSVVTIKVETTGDTIDVATGDIVGTWTTGPVDPVVGGYTGSHAAPAGFQFQWLTADIVRGRRARGKTYIVPSAPDMFENDGTLGAALITEVTGAGAVLVAAQPQNMAVYSRPSAGSPGWTDVNGRTHPAKPAHVGSYSVVTAVRVPDKAIVLRSRRD